MISTSAGIARGLLRPKHFKIVTAFRSTMVDDAEVKIEKKSGKGLQFNIVNLFGKAKLYFRDFL